MLQIYDLPNPLGSLVEKFASMNRQLQVPYQANGQCITITGRFYQFLCNSGYPRELMDYHMEYASWWWRGSAPHDSGSISLDIGPKTPHNFYYNNGHPGHVCAWVAEEDVYPTQGYFIDFTARQYHKDTPFPLIWRA